MKYIGSILLCFLLQLVQLIIMLRLLLRFLYRSEMMRNRLIQPITFSLSALMLESVRLNRLAVSVNG